jgi:putative transcriptional regulator
MTTKKTAAAEKSRFAAEMAESFEGLHKLGMIDEATYKTTLRDLNRDGGEDVILPLSAVEIRALRESAHVSQAVLAKHLNLSVDHISKLERGAVRPTGALLAMLNVIRRKGFEAIL